MATTIKLKNGSGAPTTGDLVQGEPAFDLTNKRLYTEDSGGTVIEVGTNPSTLTVDTTTLVVDAGNNRVGVGTASPNYKADVAGTLNAQGLQVKGASSLSFNASNWMTQQETGVARTYICGPDASTYQPWEIYRATSTGGASLTMSLDAAGFVGIGTASPTTNLDVRNNISMGDGTSVTQLSMIRNSANYIAATNASGYLVFRTGGANERMRIDSSGNLLVGKTSNDNTTNGFVLDANGTLNIVRSSEYLMRLNRTTTDGEILRFQKGGTTVGSIGSNNSAGTPVLDISANSSSGIMRMLTSGTERMRIDSSGNVGIGVSGGFLGGGTLALQRDKAIRWQDASDGTQYADIYGSLSSALVFRTGSSSTERMRIDSSGNVSIGTSNSLGVLTIKAPSSDDQDIITITEDGTNQSFSINGNLAGAGSTGNVITLDSFWANDIIAFRGDGNVGIGTASPNATLAFGGNSDVAFNTSLGSTGTYGQIKAFNTLAPTNPATNIRFIRDVASVGNDGAICFDTVNTERMRIDSSGNLLVGQTSGSSTDTGHIFNPIGVAFHIRDGGVPLVAVRKTDDGKLIEFKKDAAVIGSIGSSAGNSIFIGSGDVGVRFSDTNDAIYPMTTGGINRDNAIDLGLLSVRFDDIYATNGTIQTSDANEKQDIETLSEAETRVAVAAKALLRKFRWKSAVEEKGDDARIHFGIIAQDLKAAFEAEGLDAGRYAMFIHSTWTDEETGEERSRMGVRYSELLAFIIAAI